MIYTPNYIPRYITLFFDVSEVCTYVYSQHSDKITILSAFSLSRLKTLFLTTEKGGLVVFHVVLFLRTNV